jgi:uncharacterized lipoprotein YddW (UPF0748 family)
VKRKPILAAILTLTSTSVHGATPELRGVWVSTTGIGNASSTVLNRAAVNANFQRLRNVGLNTVYMDAWRNGATYYPSQVVSKITGTTLASDAGGRDLFGDTLIQSHRNGMAQFAWLQYGFSPEFLNGGNTMSKPLTTYMRDRGWLLKDINGNYSNSTYKFAWMNPLVPEVRKLIIDIGVEMVRKYDLDGIQFDDRLAWPVDFGFDDYTRAAYLAETGRSLPTTGNNSQFRTWRAQKITDFAKEFSIAMRQANPNVIVSATPGVYGFVYNNYSVDSPAWTRTNVTVNGQSMPLFDEIVPQVYNSTVTGFTNDWNYQLSQFDSVDRADYGAGISINNSAGAPYNWETINKLQANVQRNSAGTKGHIWWYSDGVLNTNEAAMTDYYNVAANGHAPRPDRPADWRPLPEVASTVGGGTWSFTLDATERYQVIARSGDTWTVLYNTVLPAGDISMNLGTYAQVEALIDRRGFTAGDANFDRRVDLDDFFILARNLNGSGALWTQGDFTLDGVVDVNDLNVLATYWGVGTPAGSLPALATLIPEPGALGVLAGLLTLRRSRRET